MFLRVEFHSDPNPLLPPLPAGIDETQHVVLARPAVPDLRFANPHWTPIGDINHHIGETIEIWAPEHYTAVHLFGPDGIAVREEVAAAVRKAGAEVRARLGEWQ